MSQPKYTETVLARLCPQCDAVAGDRCVSRSGKTATVPHGVRVANAAKAEEAKAEEAKAARQAQAQAETQASTDKEREAKVNRAKDNLIALRNGTDPYAEAQARQAAKAKANDEARAAEKAQKAKAKAEAAATAQIKADAAPKARAKNSHVNCTHPRTHEGRVACRKARKLAAALATAKENTDAC